MNHLDIIHFIAVILSALSAGFAVTAAIQYRMRKFYGPALLICFFAAGWALIAWVIFWVVG